VLVRVDTPPLGQVVEPKIVDVTVLLYPPALIVTVVAQLVTGPIWEHEAVYVEIETEVRVKVALSKSVLVW
jgi:hypothetical protein